MSLPVSIAGVVYTVTIWETMDGRTMASCSPVGLIAMVQVYGWIRPRRIAASAGSLAVLVVSPQCCAF